MTTLQERLAEYMRTKMAMPDAATDQEQNWIAGHMFTFASLERMRANLDAGGREERLKALLASADDDNGGK